jgi:hypothetical protein
MAGNRLGSPDPLGSSTQLDEIARRANVPNEFVRRLTALGALSDDVSTAVCVRIPDEYEVPKALRVLADHDCLHWRYYSSREQTDYHVAGPSGR